MSSHREAPEMAKDPVADSTDVYAFVSPDRPNTVTLIANYIPFQAPDGGPNFNEFGDDVAYDINISNKGKGEADIVYRFHFTTRMRDAKTFLYNTGPISSIHDTDVEPAAVLLPDPDQERQEKGARRAPALPAGQHRPAQHAELPPPGGPGRAHGRPPQSLRRAAGRCVPRRPRQCLRPRSAAAVPAPAPDPDGRHRGAQLAAGLQRALARAPGADLGGQPWRRRAPQPGAGEVRHRGVVLGEPPEVPDVRQAEGRVRRARSLGAGLPARQPALQRGDHPDGAQGHVERAGAEGRRVVREVRQPPGAGPAAAGALPGRLPAPRGVPQDAGGPERHPADRHPERESCPGSRTSPGPSSRTCSG